MELHPFLQDFLQTLLAAKTSAGQRNKEASFVSCDNILPMIRSYNVMKQRGDNRFFR